MHTWIAAYAPPTRSFTSITPHKIWKMCWHIWIHAVTTFNRFVLHRIASHCVASLGWMAVPKAACSKCACATQLLIEGKRAVRKLWNWLHFISLCIYCWTLVGVNTRSEQNCASVSVFGRRTCSKRCQFLNACEPSPCFFHSSLFGVAPIVHLFMLAFLHELCEIFSTDIYCILW